MLICLLLALPELYAQVDSSYSFIAAGHAYGSHDGDNQGLHPPLLNSLQTGLDSTVAFIVFTGDIVNLSTVESWKKVDEELDSLSLSSYYVMGNHDYTEEGIAVFNEKYGGTYYSWYQGGELHIVLNSIEADRAISPVQLLYLQDKIEQSGDATRNIFIYFHELIWNSHEKYIDVRSNSRSRYDQVVNYSNYWEEVHPMLMEKPDKNFFLIAGDVGGNADAIAAFYDRWDHITFLASGMGEVEDENYLLVHVSAEDSISFELVALRSDLELPAVESFSIPSAPFPITGPALVNPGDSSVEYAVHEVSNADFYLWQLPPGTEGSSSIHRIELDFSEDFKEGILAVQAEKDGFGKSTETSMSIAADATQLNSKAATSDGIQMDVAESLDNLHISLSQVAGKQIILRIMDTGGRVWLTRRMYLSANHAEIQIDKNELPSGILILSLSSSTQYICRKIQIRKGGFL